MRIRKIMIVVVAVFVILLVLFLPATSNGLYNGAPLVVSSNGPLGIEIKNNEVFLVEDGRSFKIGNLDKKLYMLGTHVISSVDNHKSCKVNFYTFGAIFYDSSGKYMGWGRRVLKWN